MKVGGFGMGRGCNLGQETFGGRGVEKNWYHAKFFAPPSCGGHSNFFPQHTVRWAPIIANTLCNVISENNYGTFIDC
jgi:hypothetical protein